MRVLLSLLLFSVIILADEALVDIATWDVITVKPDGSKWGICETNNVFYCVKRIENEFTFDNDPNTVIIYPYAIYSNKYPHGDISNLTTKAVNDNKVIKMLIKRSEYQIKPTANDKNKKLK